MDMAHKRGNGKHEIDQHMLIYKVVHDILSNVIKEICIKMCRIGYFYLKKECKDRHKVSVAINSRKEAELKTLFASWTLA